jgi:hypothetical protein
MMKSQSKYLVLSRGQWDQNAAKEDIDAAIGRFYEWYSSNLTDGRIEPGSRLSTEAALVSRSGISTDGPFCEAKEVIGGYWIIVAGSLREAAELAAQNPCVAYGLQFEIRPLEAERASAYKVTNETPGQKKGC